MKIDDLLPTNESKTHPNSKIYDKCWSGYRKVPGKKRGEKGSCVKIKEADDDQTSLNFSGGEAIHPAWKEFFDNSDNIVGASRNAAAALYKRLKGKPATKADVKDLWKNTKISMKDKLLFKPNYDAILYHYNDLISGKPPVGHTDEAENSEITTNSIEESYDGDDFYSAYGDLWYNDDEQLDEAEYQGRKVKLGKPMRGDVKKFKVYVRNPKGNVVKVNFGDPDMKIRKSNPQARKSFRARHNCDNPGPRHKARYWSCRKW